MLHAHFSMWPNVGVANGPLKTLSLVKFSSNFTGLAVLYFSSYVPLMVSIFLRSCLGVSICRKAKGLELESQFVPLSVFINDVFLLHLILNFNEANYKFSEKN